MCGAGPSPASVSLMIAKIIFGLFFCWRCLRLPALAWGYAGHRYIGELAARNFPKEIPAFLRTPAAATQIGILAQEPDTSRNAGQPHDDDLDPGHFLDVSDDGTILGGPELTALPATREAYDTALRAAGSNEYKAGFLPYNLMDGWQQLVKDFALLRRDMAAQQICRQIRHHRRRAPHLCQCARRAPAADSARSWECGRILSAMPASPCMSACITMAGAMAPIRKALSPARPARQIRGDLCRRPCQRGGCGGEAAAHAFLYRAVYRACSGLSVRHPGGPLAGLPAGKGRRLRCRHA